MAKRKLTLPWGFRRYFSSTSTRGKRRAKDDKTLHGQSLAADRELVELAKNMDVAAIEMRLLER